MTGLSSNENSATFNHNHGLRALRDILHQLQKDSGLVFVAAFGKDGLTTNVNGFCELFDRLDNAANIRLALYLGRNDLRVYDVSRLIGIIQDCKANGLKSDLPSGGHALLADWYSAMYDKEQAVASLCCTQKYANKCPRQARHTRDLKTIMPIRRNASAIVLERSPRPEITTTVLWDEHEAQRRSSAATRDGLARKGVLIQPYELRQEADSLELECVVDACQEYVTDLDALIQHVQEHSKEIQRCILCPLDKPTS